ncbi:MAG TPA: hypothetical protein PLX80_03295 [Ignavibacteria bacterium]|nr:hypothetical protein [Ignavibacteria bacterium]
MNNRINSPDYFLKLLAIVILITSTGCEQINKVLYKDAGTEADKKVDENSNLKFIDSGKVNSKNESINTAIDSVVRTFEGLITINLNEKSFRDCSNPDSLYFIKDETETIVNSYKKLNPMNDIYRSVFTSLKGFTVNADSTNNPDPEKYFKILVIKEVIAVEGKNFRNTCIPYDYWCLGNEPNWSLQISKEENIFELTLPFEGKSYYFNYNEPKEEDGMIKYFGYNNIQRTTLNISIKKENCSDTMSDKIYEYSVKIILNDKTNFSGCAIKGNFIE